MRRRALPVLLLLASCAREPGPRRAAWEGFRLGITPTARTLQGFVARFDRAREAGETLARIHLTHGLPRAEAPPGEVDEAWCRSWDSVFEAASARGISVIPVLSAWAHWNDGSRGERWHTWDRNPYNAALGGPARAPSDLLLPGPAREAFLRELSAKVARFSGHRCIVAWEPFSELDLVTGARGLDRGAVVAFAEAASDAARRSDPEGRPVTLSLSGVQDWPELWSSPAVDLVQLHPYPGPRRGYDLFRETARAVEARRAFGKPVLLGECGLSPGPPDPEGEDRPRAHVGYRQAAWAALMSGASNAGMFWWLGGYGRMGEPAASPTLGLRRFLEQVDVAGLAPGRLEAPEGTEGLCLRAGGRVAGYLRDAACLHPDWPASDREGLRLALGLPEGADVVFYRPSDGTELARARADAEGAVALPAFGEDLAFATPSRTGPPPRPSGRPPSR